MVERLSVETSQPEHKEHEPKINYHFLFSTHRTAEDFSNLEEAFKKADIYVPERFGWTTAERKYYQAVSDGKILPEQIEKNKNSNQYQAFKVMYDSKKPILFADIPVQDRNFIEEFKKLNSNEEAIMRAFVCGEFSKSLELTRAYIEKFAKWNLERETKIKEKLDKQIKRLLENNPEYSNKKELNVLIKLGVAHTTIFHRLRHEGRSVSMEFISPLIVHLSLSEAIRRKMFNKTISDELLARGIIEELSGGLFLSITNDTNKIFLVVKKLFSKLTLKDIQEISETAGRNKGEIDIIQELESRGIKVPKTEEEMDEMLGLDKKEK